MGDPSLKPPIVPTIDTSGDDKMWAMLAHMSFLLTFVIGISCIAPLIIWLMKKESSEFIADQAKEALNFQLAAMIAVLVLSATCIGAILLPVVVVGGVVYSILGGMAANRGEVYRYPYTFRMIN